MLEISTWTLEQKQQQSDFVSKHWNMRYCENYHLNIVTEVCSFLSKTVWKVSPAVKTTVKWILCSHIWNNLLCSLLPILCIIGWAKRVVKGPALMAYLGHLSTPWKLKSCSWPTAKPFWYCRQEDKKWTLARWLNEVKSNVYSRVKLSRSSGTAIFVDLEKTKPCSDQQFTYEGVNVVSPFFWAPVCADPPADPVHAACPPCELSL